MPTNRQKHIYHRLLAGDHIVNRNGQACLRDPDCNPVMKIDIRTVRGLRMYGIIRRIQVGHSYRFVADRRAIRKLDGRTYWKRKYKLFTAQRILIQELAKHNDECQHTALKSALSHLSKAAINDKP